MSLIYPHRLWITILAMALLMLLASSPLLAALQEHTAKKLTALKEERAGVEKSLHQLEIDIQAVKEISGEIGETEAKRLLAPIDRLWVAEVLEHEAATSRLARFTYNMSPEQVLVKNLSGGEPQELAITTIAITSEAPLDTDVYSFIENIRRTLPGRLRLQQLSLERLGKEDTTLGIYNVRFNATLEWLSNGSLKTMAGG